MYRLPAASGLFLGFIFCITAHIDESRAALPLRPNSDPNDSKLPAELANYLKKYNHVEKLIQQLGDEDFDVRDQATWDLILLGRIAASALQERTNDPDPEIAYRATRSLRYIEKQRGDDPLAALLKRIVAAKPAGAVPVLLDGLDVLRSTPAGRELENTLEAIALHDGKPLPELLDALTDQVEHRRFLSARVFIRAKIEAALPAVRKLLDDPVPSIRQRVGIELATRAADKHAVSKLIDMLADQPRENTREIELLLFWLARDGSPAPPREESAEARKQYRADWKAWWEQQQDRVELPFLDMDLIGLGHKTLRGHQNHTWTVAFSPDGRSIASGSSDRTVRVWDSVSGTTLWTPKAFPTNVSSIAYSPDGKLLAACSSRILRIWDAATGALKHEIATPLNSMTLTFSPDSSMLATGGRQSVVLWNVQTGKEHKSIKEAPNTNITTITFSPDGKTLAWGMRTIKAGSKNQIRLWNIGAWEETRMIDLNHANNIHSLTFSPDGKMLAVGGYDVSGIQIWDNETGKVVHQFPGQYGFMHSVAFSPDRKTIAVSGPKLIRLMSLETGKELHHWTVASNPFGIAFSPDGGRLAAGSDDHAVHVFDVVSALAKEFTKK